MTAMVRRGPRKYKKVKAKRVKTKDFKALGKSSIPLPKSKRKTPIRDSASSRAPCRICGEQLHFDIHKTTSALIRLNEDGTDHEHQDG